MIECLDFGVYYYGVIDVGMEMVVGYIGGG